MSRDTDVDAAPTCLRSIDDSGAPCGNDLPCPIHQSDAYCDVPSGALWLPCGAARPCAVHASRFASGRYFALKADDRELLATARRRVVAYMIERYGTAAPVADLIVQRDTLGEALARTQLDQVNETRRLKVKLDDAERERYEVLHELKGAQVPTPTHLGRHGKPVLAPRFVEWLMGLPDGWVTGLDLPRTQALKVLGNGVVAHQAVAALQILLCPHRWQVTR